MYNDRLAMVDQFNIGERMTIIDESDVMNVTDDKFHPHTRVRIYDKETGALLWQGCNKVMLSGSEFMALHLFGVEGDSFITPTYNSQLGLDHNQSNSGNDTGLAYKVKLFCMGTSGCNRGSRIKNEVSNKNWIQPEDMVPFRYQLTGDDLDDTLREIYNGRKTMADRGRVAYYFKRFDSDPVVNKLYNDGTPWLSNIYNDGTTMGANVKISLTATIDEEDGRDWFDQTSGINDAVFNCIELCTAWASEVDGYTYYQDIRPVTRLNFPDRALNEAGSSFAIKYDLIF